MDGLPRRRRVEYEILGVVILILILNSFVFAILGFKQGSVVQTILNSVFVAFAVYIVFIAFDLICIAWNKSSWLLWTFYILLVFMTSMVAFNLAYLMVDPRISTNGFDILSDGMLVWVTSILTFSLWYWIIDRGGPIARMKSPTEKRYDLLFPQYQSSIPGWGNWSPRFPDYIFFSFFTSTGFSPADTLPLTIRAKTLMMIEATISLVIIGMVVGRATSLVH